MKKTGIVIISFAFLLSCKGKEQIVTIENPSDYDRLTDLVEIPLKNLNQIVLNLGDTYRVVNAAGEVIPSQLTFDSKLIFQPGLKANESATFTIGTGKPQPFPSKTFGRYVPERKDDFAWENDRVAFRIYGQALIATDGPSNGLDAWYKRTSELVIDKWYENDLTGIASYHSDNGEGLDDYKVGRTLGAGAMAPYLNDTLWLNENYISQKTLENGPLRTTFQLSYKNLTVGEQTYSETRTFSIDAGSQLTKVTQEYGGVEKPMSVAAGFVKRSGKDSIFVSPKNNYLVYVEPFSETVDQLYMGIVFPQGFEKETVNTYAYNEKALHVLTVTTYLPDTPLTYYTGFGWSKFGFASASEFQNYLSHFVTSLKNPFIVTY
ncbi:MAG: DUF4861 domain-containing protein [Bacteroidales bacterium]|jgi:hypothetical protein|nr:DUF4861 domain-containing protein [Bacteroidales bacterium]